MHAPDLLPLAKRRAPDRRCTGALDCVVRKRVHLNVHLNFVCVGASPPRATVSARVQATLDDLGKGLGPALVAALVSITSRIAAFNVAIAGWIPCGLLLVLAGRTISPDEGRVQRQLARVAARAAPPNDGFLATSAMEGVATPAMSAACTDDGHTPTGVLRGALELGLLGHGSSSFGRSPSMDVRSPSIEPATRTVAENAPLLG